MRSRRAKRLECPDGHPCFDLFNLTGDIRLIAREDGIVVTEDGIATLRRKSIKDRARELIAVAHKDFGEELSAEAERLYG